KAGERKVSMRGTEAGWARTGAAPTEAPDPALAAKGEYETVLTQAQLDAWVAKLQAAEALAFDTETDSFDPLCANLIGISVAVETGQAAYIPFGHDYPGAPQQLPRSDVLDALRPLFADANKRKLGQHGKYDLHVLRCHGVDVHGY